MTGGNEGKRVQTLVANKLAATGIPESIQLELSPNVLSAVRYLN